MPNTLLLISDEHNPFYSSVYGHPTVQTPNMQRLAERGTVFENTYCPSPLCVPSRSAFMSGRRVHRIQTYNNCITCLDRNIPAYGGALNAAGIHSVHAGKSHVWNAPSKLGFNRVLSARDDMGYPGDTNFCRQPLTIRKGAARRADASGVKEGAFSHDLRVMDASLEWLAEEAGSIQTPWVLAVNLIKPHFPHYTTREFWDLYSEEGDLPAYGPEEESARHPYARDLRRHFETEGFSEAQVRNLRKGYYACVSFIDSCLGRLMNALEAAELLEDTNVLYTSDHGDMLGKFGMWWKCTLYEDSSRIPCIAAGPDFPKGSRVRTPVDLHDVQASVFSSVGAERPSEWVGEPLQGLAENDAERIVFSEYHGHGTRAGAYMIRKGAWKLIYYAAAENQLFNLEEDPNELHNLSGRCPDKAKELEEELRGICSPEEENEKAERFIRRQLRAVAEGEG